MSFFFNFQVINPRFIVKAIALSVHSYIGFKDLSTPTTAFLFSLGHFSVTNQYPNSATYTSPPFALNPISPANQRIHVLQILTKGLNKVGL